MAEPEQTLSIRTASVGDAPAIAAIGDVAFRAAHDSVVGPVAAAEIVRQTYSIDALTTCINLCANADDAHFLVAEDDGKVVGYVHYDSEGPEPELHRIYTDPNRKRGGIGSALLRELHSRLEPGTSYLLLVAEENFEAQAFYERHGFVLEARVIGAEYYNDAMGVDVAADEGYPDRALVLRKTLRRAVVNGEANPHTVPPPSRDAARFHKTLSGYAPTPVRELPELARELGVAAVLVKDESSRLGLPAFKILGASWAVERALHEQPRAETLVAASAGNHGRAVSHAAAARGLRCRIFLPERSLPVRRDAIAGEGADVVVVNGSYEDAVAAAEAEAASPGTLLISDTGSSRTAGWVIDGYATLFDEAYVQAVYDLLIVPVGVGSLGAAAARHGASIGAHVVGVEPSTAACLAASLAAGRLARVDNPGTSMAGLDCAELSQAAWPSLQAGIHGSVAITDEETRAALHELEAHGLEIGESGAAPLAALRALATEPDCQLLRAAVDLGPTSRVLLIATEGRTGDRQHH
jgi:diaminopropionate ammonia-lyase